MANTARFFAIHSDDDLRRVIQNAAKHAPHIVAMAKEELERRHRAQRRAVHFVRQIRVEPVRRAR